MNIRALLHGELTGAMRRRDNGLVSHLRAAVAALDNAESVAEELTPSDGSPIAGAVAGLGAAEARRFVLSDPEQRAVLTREMSELAAHAERLDLLSRSDDADAARRALSILEQVARPQVPTPDDSA